MGDNTVRSPGMFDLYIYENLILFYKQYINSIL